MCAMKVFLKSFEIDKYLCEFIDIVCCFPHIVVMFSANIKFRYIIRSTYLHAYTICIRFPIDLISRNI